MFANFKKTDGPFESHMKISNLEPGLSRGGAMAQTIYGRVLKEVQNAWQNVNGSFS